MLDLSLDDIIFNSMIYICGSKSGSKWQRSVEFAQRMNLASVKQDLFTYNTLLNSYEILGRWPDGVQLLVKLQQQLGHDFRQRLISCYFVFSF